LEIIYDVKETYTLLVKFEDLRMKHVLRTLTQIEKLNLEEKAINWLYKSVHEESEFDSPDSEMHIYPENIYQINLTFYRWKIEIQFEEEKKEDKILSRLFKTNPVVGSRRNFSFNYLLQQLMKKRRRLNPYLTNWIMISQIQVIVRDY
jgi:hypothetical protein